MLGRSLWVVAALLASVSGWEEEARAQPAPTASAQVRAEADLEAARRRFAWALREEQASRYAAALDDLRSVREVRETASVDYHMGVCLESLGQIASAVSTYESAARLGERDASMADVTAASRARADALSNRVARLTLVLSSHGPAAVDVSVDGAPASVGGDVVLDPGHHHVKVVAAGAAPFESDIALPAGGRASLVLALDAPSPSTPAPQAATAAHAVSTPDGDSGRNGNAIHAAGWVTVGSGALLLAAAVTSLALRESDIAKADRLCPGGGCIGSIDSGAQEATGRARVEGPLGWALGATSLVTLGVGLYLVSRPFHSAAVVSVGPWSMPCGGGLELRAAL